MNVTYAASEVFTLPLLHTRVTLEVAEILQVQRFILAVEFSSTLLSTSNDGLDIVINHHPKRERETCKYTATAQKEIRKRTDQTS